MNLTQIQLRDFRAFAGELNLPLPDGCNLLLHGENGSGKSSLSCALREFFTFNPDSQLAPTKKPIDQFRHAFPDTNPTPQPRIAQAKLTFTGARANSTETISWEERQLHPLEAGDGKQPEPTTKAQREMIAAVSRCSGFFDYRALLRASLTKQPEKLAEQLFDLFAETLLAGFRVRTHGGEETINKLWSAAKKAKPRYRYANYMRRANATVEVFDRAFRPFLAQLTDKANEFLYYFPNHRLRIVKLDYTGSTYAKETLEMTGRAIIPEIEFNGQKVDQHQEFLNEARLTALGLSVFLAAVALADANPADPDPLRLLVLDDVLIGLDLNNRLPLLELLRTQFPRHQILLLTHDLVWFDIAREHTAEWGDSKWNHARLFEEPAGPAEPFLPRFERIKPNMDDLKIAEGYIRVGDLRAAAVYIRAAYEATIKNICEKNGIEVVFKANPKEVKADALWRGILRRHATRLKQKRGEFIEPGLIPRISAVRSAVLNRLSHSGSSSLTSIELTTALQTIRDLRNSKIPFKP
jgi:energy-coupling factor transporter ATP-binding protein EcfA2